MSYVDGSVQRQRDFKKHSAIKPLAGLLTPKVGRESAVADKIEILAVRNFELTHAEARNIYLVLGKLVIPTEFAALLSQGHQAGCDCDRRIRHAHCGID